MTKYLIPGILALVLWFLKRTFKWSGWTVAIIFIVIVYLFGVVMSGFGGSGTRLSPVWIFKEILGIRPKTTSGPIA